MAHSAIPRISSVYRSVYVGQSDRQTDELQRSIIPINLWLLCTVCLSLTVDMRLVQFL